MMAGEPATAVAAVTAGFVTGITVTAGGSGYIGEPTVSLSGGGGGGAAAKAIMSGDKVAQIIVLNAGAGYTSAPVVAIELPPRPWMLGFRLVPEITVSGPVGALGQIEWSATLGQAGGWQILTNVTVGTDGLTVVDLAVGSGTRYYRAVTAPNGMALIPAGLFQMGDAFYEGQADEQPVRAVFVSAFYMDKFEVTKALWDEVKVWGDGNGYVFPNPGNGKAANHPVQYISWDDAVVWCNARSQKEGKVPAYYANAELTKVYKTRGLAPFVNWNAGYRLPTEAEWEKAARGGVSGHRFPWSAADKIDKISHADTISWIRANYSSVSSDPYDISNVRGYNPIYAVGNEPFTSPVGSFVANGYGLYDMAGNVAEYCWDGYAPYPTQMETVPDPRGPTRGSFRVIRGGSWFHNAVHCRTARRYGSAESPSTIYGFRTALPVRQQ